MPVFGMALVLLLVATGMAAFKTKQALEEGDRRAFFVQATLTLPLLAVTCLATWLFFSNDSLATRYLPASNLVGSNWDCAHYGKGAQVCFKQQAPARATH